MINVLFGTNITLGGCCDHTKFGGSEEILEYFTHLMRDADLLVYGRKTYQLMVPFWPDVAKNQSMTKAANEFAQAFDSINKVVFLQSLNTAEGKSTRIVRTKLQKTKSTLPATTLPVALRPRAEERRRHTSACPPGN